jgi:ornithine cyclodeaminase/alanine dehydrogenase-like protein (mu-crystallin family)
VSIVAQEVGIRSVAVENPESCVHGADIVITCTNSANPVFDGAWLLPGTHINAIGANAPGRTELGEDTIMRCSIIAIDDLEQAKIEAEELLALAAGGRLRCSRIEEIGDIVQGKAQGRTQADEITLFRSLGIGLEDVALAACVFDKATGAGVGRQVQT